MLAENVLFRSSNLEITVEIPLLVMASVGAPFRTSRGDCSTEYIKTFLKFTGKHLWCYPNILTQPSTFNMYFKDTILTTQLTFTCSNSTKETLCSKLTIKTPERRQWRRAGVFINNFEQVLLVGYRVNTSRKTKSNFITKTLDFQSF